MKNRYNLKFDRPHRQPHETDVETIWWVSKDGRLLGFVWAVKGMGDDPWRNSEDTRIYPTRGQAADELYRIQAVYHTRPVYAVKR